MGIKCFRDDVCSENLSFLLKDQFAFSVLLRILEGKCALTIMEGQRLVICHSVAPYPVWIWTPDDASETEMERAYLLTKEYLGISGHRFNLKYPLAKYFMHRAQAEGIELQVETNMLAYSCEKTIPPKRTVAGRIETAGEEDLATVVELLRRFYIDTGMEADIASDEAYIEKAKRHISQGFYFWNVDGVRVATAGRHPVANQCNINAVYTEKEHRRKGYASHLVYEVAKEILAEGKLPTLYTDADYSASNACYTKIGFVCQGGLCSIG